MLPMADPQHFATAQTAWTAGKQAPAPSAAQHRPLLPRRNISAPRVQTLAREKPYTRRKSSSINTFTNAHELALWESKMRNPGQSQAGGGYRLPTGEPVVQMTAIPMVQDYLLPANKLYPSSDNNSTPPPLSPPGQSPHSTRPTIALQMGQEGAFTVDAGFATSPLSQTAYSSTNWTSPVSEPLDQHWGTIQPQYPQDVVSVYTAPIFPAEPPTATATPQQQQQQQHYQQQHQYQVPVDGSVLDAQPFTPYGPYPAGQCVWYYYDPDNSPMPPPPVPTTSQPAPPIPTAEHPDPFPGALSDTKGWYLLDLKTNLPFHVPFDPTEATASDALQPDVEALAAARALRLRTPKATAKAQSASPQAHPRPGLHARSASVPSIPLDMSPPGGSTSPLTPMTPGSLSTVAASDNDNGSMSFPTISPALYYTNPAHMSSLFKRRQGKGGE